MLTDRLIPSPSQRLPALTMWPSTWAWSSPSSCAWSSPSSWRSLSTVRRTASSTRTSSTRRHSTEASSRSTSRRPDQVGVGGRSRDPAGETLPLTDKTWKGHKDPWQTFPPGVCLATGQKLMKNNFNFVGATRWCEIIFTRKTSRKSSTHGRLLKFEFNDRKYFHEISSAHRC